MFLFLIIVIIIIQDIPVPDIGREAEKKDRRRHIVDHLLSSPQSSASSSPEPTRSHMASEERQRTSSGNHEKGDRPLIDRQMSTRPLGAVEFQQLQVGEMTAALLCSPVLNISSMGSSTTASTGAGGNTNSTQSTQNNTCVGFEQIKIKASGRSFKTSLVHMRDLMKRKALTIPQTVRYDEKGDQFYVDCSAEVFEEVFDFFRTGDLHLPKKVCIEKSLREMRRLNVFPNMLAPCCFARYDRFRAQKEAMKIWYEQLVKDPAEDESPPPSSLSGTFPVTSSKQVPLRLRIWNFLENPFSSKFATAYSWITVLMVALSITGFIVETLPKIDQLLGEYKFTSNFGALVNLCGSMANPENKTTNHQIENQRNISEAPLIKPVATTLPPCVMSNKRYHSIASLSDEEDLTVSECYLAVVLWFIDYFCAAFFTLDLLVRFIISPEKLGFFKSRLNLVDALALVPFYVELAFAIMARIAYGQGAVWRRAFKVI